MEAAAPIVSRLTRETLTGYRSTAVAAVAFGVAFGYLEAAVVVYLRSAIAGGSVAPAHDPSTLGTYEGVEMARELGTLVMITAVGWLAGRTHLERLAWAAVVFGTWDIVYYLGLLWAIGWPSAFDTWDVLFLVPMPWVGPVWAPVMVSSALVGFGLTAAHLLRAGRRLAVTPIQTGAALAGGGLVILSFLVDSDRIVWDDSTAWTGWPFFWAGLALAAAACLSALGGTRSAALSQGASGWEPGREQTGDGGARP